MIINPTFPSSEYLANQRRLSLDNFREDLDGWCIGIIRFKIELNPEKTFFNILLTNSEISPIYASMSQLSDIQLATIRHSANAFIVTHKTCLLFKVLSVEMNPICGNYVWEIATGGPNYDILRRYS